MRSCPWFGNHGPWDMLLNARAFLATRDTAQYCPCVLFVIAQEKLQRVAFSSSFVGMPAHAAPPVAARRARMYPENPFSAAKLRPFNLAQHGRSPNESNRA